MSILPKIKSTICSFLVGEEGKIAKESVLSVGAFLASAVALSPYVLGDCSGGACGCGCGCAGCAISPTPIPTPVHSSSAEMEFLPPNIEQSTHYSHSSVG
jgi:hypothetical protein